MAVSSNKELTLREVNGMSQLHDIEAKFCRDGLLTHDFSVFKISANVASAD